MHPSVTSKRRRAHWLRYCIATFVFALLAVITMNDVGVWLRPKGPIPTGVPMGASRYQRGAVEWNWSKDAHPFFTTLDALAVYATPAMPDGAGVLPPHWALSRDRLWRPDQDGGVQRSPLRLTAVGWPFRCYVHDGDQWHFYETGVAKNLAVVLSVSLAPLLCHLALLSLNRWRISRLGPGHCGECGYNLRELPAGSRCPECGQ